jgi:hypothetical protein
MDTSLTAVIASFVVGVAGAGASFYGTIRTAKTSILMEVRGQWQA